MQAIRGIMTLALGLALGLSIVGGYYGVQQYLHHRKLNAQLQNSVQQIKTAQQGMVDAVKQADGIAQLREQAFDVGLNPADWLISHVDISYQRQLEKAIAGDEVLAKLQKEIPREQSQKDVQQNIAARKQQIAKLQSYSLAQLQDMLTLLSYRPSFSSATTKQQYWFAPESFIVERLPMDSDSFSVTATGYFLVPKKPVGKKASVNGG